MNLVIHLILSILLFFSCKNNVSQKPLSDEKNSIIGEWTYTLAVCKGDVVKDADFTIQIDKEFLSAHGNLLECNSCHKGCKITNNQIIFPEKNSSAICTEKKCPYEYEFCGDKQILTKLFQDMTYTVSGDELTLEADGKVLKLKRKI